MPDTKITALTAIGANPIIPSTFPIPMVDLTDTSMAASGTTKKVTVNQILGAGGTATLASATITGDLTVDTSTLKVDSANNRVGIGTASPTATLHVSSAGSVHINQRTGGNGCFTQYVDPVSSNYVGTDSGNFRVANNSAQDLLNIQQLGVFSFGDGAGGTRMTLNATGLGVGTSPVTALSFPIGTTKVVGQSAVTGHLAGNVGTLKFGISDAGGDYSGIQVFNTHNGTYSSQDIRFFTAEGGVSVCTERMRITPSGNVGIGVTPSAWAAGWRTAQVGSRLVLSVTGSDTFLGNNWYNDGAYKFINADYATYYDQTTGKHVWGTSTTSGAVNGVITWNPAMTLDASGRFFVGLTSSPYGTSRSWFSYDGGTVYGAGYKNITAGSGTAVVFVSSTNGLAGYISTTDTTVTYASVSDYRLKQDVKPLSGGLARVNALKPSIYKWKSDGSCAEGFIAHELAEVVPSAVIGSKDEVNEDGSIKAQGVDLSKVVPVLVAAIQELTARVQTLETR